MQLDGDIGHNHEISDINQIVGQLNDPNVRWTSLCYSSINEEEATVKWKLRSEKMVNP